MSQELTSFKDLKDAIVKISCVWKFEIWKLNLRSNSCNKKLKDFQFLKWYFSQGRGVNLKDFCLIFSGQMKRKAHKLAIQN